MLNRHLLQTLFSQAERNYTIMLLLGSMELFLGFFLRYLLLLSSQTITEEILPYWFRRNEEIQRVWEHWWVWIKKKHRQDKVLSMNWHFIFLPLSDYQKSSTLATRMITWRRENTTVRLQGQSLFLHCHSLNPDIRAKGMRKKAAHSWLAYWGYCKRLC